MYDMTCHMPISMSNSSLIPSIDLRESASFAIINTITCSYYNNPHQIQHVTAIIALFKQHPTIPTSPINQRFNRILKACENAMIELTIIRKEAYDLGAAHDKKKQKHRKSTARIVTKEALLCRRLRMLSESTNSTGCK